MKVNFITLKWGKKYGPEYVNRLYKTLLNIYSGEFDFYCFTDNPAGLENNINIIDIAVLRPYNLLSYPSKRHQQEFTYSCFTIEKAFLFDSVLKGNNVLLDIDILVTIDLYPYLKEYGFVEGRFIRNGWVHKEGSELAALMGACYINSSFVTWKDDQLKFILDFYNKHKKIIEFKYEDIDTFLFQCLRDRINYHPIDMVTSYTVNQDYNVLKDFPIILFNTSHVYGTHHATELHQASNWATKLWKQYD